jgi:signal transduction histidine kinase
MVTTQSNTNMSLDLESLSRTQLLRAVRHLLAETDAISSRLVAVNEIGIAINGVLDLDNICMTISQYAKWLIDCDHCSMYLYDDQTEGWHLNTLFGPEEAQLPPELCQENFGIVIDTKQAQLFNNGTPSGFLKDYQSQLVIPLVADDFLLGTINFACAEPNHYTQDDMRIGYILSLQLSSAVRNAYTFQELKRTQQELSLRVKELDAYGHTIAHDLKSPLSGMLMGVDLLMRRFADELPQRGHDYLDMIRDSGVQMNQMIDRLLMLAKLRHTKESAVPVEVGPVVEAALNRFRHKLEAHAITVEVIEPLPPIMGQAQWVEEVFANFISNAIKYRGLNQPNPQISIRGFRQEDSVRYEVIDNGVGISEEDQHELFEMFSRVDTSHEDGLGLGLSIVRRIMNNLGGQVGVESVYGKGSTFWFVLPATKVICSGSESDSFNP